MPVEAPIDHYRSDDFPISHLHLLTEIIKKGLSSAHSILAEGQRQSPAARLAQSYALVNGTVTDRALPGGSARGARH